MKYRGTQTASTAGVMALSEYFFFFFFLRLLWLAIIRPLWPVFIHTFAQSGTQRAPLPEVLLCCLALQAHRGIPVPGVLFGRSEHQALKGAPWVGSFSVTWFIRHLMGQPLYCSAARCWHVEKEAMVTAPPITHDSAVSPCFHGCLAFLHRHFLP